MYLFLQREKNRILTQEYVDSPFYQIPGLASKHLEETGKDLDLIEKILSSACPCLNLATYIPGNRGATEV